MGWVRVLKKNLIKKNRVKEKRKNGASASEGKVYQFRGTLSMAGVNLLDVAFGVRFYMEHLRINKIFTFRLLGNMVVSTIGVYSM